MDPVSAVSAIIGGGAGLISAGLNLWGNKKSQKRSISAQSALFNQQKAWEKEKMQNAWQWSMDDLQKAGLNPTLMMGNASGATMAGSSTPGAVGTPSTNTNLIGEISSALKISKELGLMDAQKENIDADTELKGAQSGKTKAETEFQKTQNKYQEQLLNLEVTLKNETNSEIRARIGKTLYEVSQIQKQIEKTEKEIDILKSQGLIAEAEAKTRVNNRRAFAILEMTESATRSVGNIVGAAKGTSAMPTYGNTNSNINSNSVTWYMK